MQILWELSTNELPMSLIVWVIPASLYPKWMEVHAAPEVQGSGAGPFDLSYSVHFSNMHPVIALVYLKNMLSKRKLIFLSVKLDHFYLLQW